MDVNILQFNGWINAKAAIEVSTLEFSISDDSILLLYGKGFWVVGFWIIFILELTHLYCHFLVFLDDCLFTTPCTVRLNSELTEILDSCYANFTDTASGATAANQDQSKNCNSSRIPVSISYTIFVLWPARAIEFRIIVLNTIIVVCTFEVCITVIWSIIILVVDAAIIIRTGIAWSSSIPVRDCSL